MSGLFTRRTRLYDFNQIFCFLLVLKLRCEAQSVVLNSASHNKPYAVGCVGLPRSSSTLLYNIVRLVATHMDPNTLSGWIDDDLSGNQTYRQYVLNEVRTSPVVYKAHEMSFELRIHTDYVFVSHRDPIDSISSLVCMFPQLYNTTDRACIDFTYFIRNIENITGTQAFEHNHLKTKLGVFEAIHKVHRILRRKGSSGAFPYRQVYKALQLLRPPAWNEFSRFGHQPTSLLHHNHKTTSCSHVTFSKTFETKACRETLATYLNAFL